MVALIGTLILCVCGLIYAEIRRYKPAIYLLKPGATLLVIAVALQSWHLPQHNAHYSIGVLVGLALCLGGDLALMFQERRQAFMLGLVLFLLGHIAYTVTFTLFASASLAMLAVSALLLAIAVAFYRLIAANLGSMRIPVILYFLVISIMVIQACGLINSPAMGPAQVALVIGGAGLFYISDVILAANRFWRPWNYNRISLGFYYAGQLLIAMSASYFP